MMDELTPLTSWAQANRETIYPEMIKVDYPFRDFLDALKEKDAALFAQHSYLTPADFVREWKKVYPEDFPQGTASEASPRSIVQNAP